MRTLPYLKTFYNIPLINTKNNVSETPIKAFDFSTDKRSIFFWE